MRTKWPTVPLGEVLLEPISYGANCAAVEFSERLPRYLRITDIDERGTLIEDRKVSAVLEDPLPYQLRPQDILLARSGATVGKSYLHEMKSDRVVFAGYLLRVRVDSNRLLPVVLKAQLETDAYWVWVRSTCRAGAQPNINASEYARLPVIVPPLKVQRSVASVIRCFGVLESKVDALVAAKRRLKRALMQRLCLEPTVPTIATRIGDVATEVVDRAGGRKVRILSCTKHDGLVDSLTYFGRQIFSGDTSAYRVVKRGQLAYATNHIEEGSIGLLREFEEGAVSPMYTVFECADGVDPEYLFATLKTERYRVRFADLTSGSVNRRGGLRWSSFSKIGLRLPPLGWQQQASSTLRVVERQINTLNELLAALRLQKRGVMQKLLSGDLDSLQKQ